MFFFLFQQIQRVYEDEKVQQEHQQRNVEELLDKVTR